MKAVLLESQRVVLSEAAFAEVTVWQVPAPVPGSLHLYKYRLAYVDDGRCVLRYDNERGKGDHKHLDGKEHPYVFSDVDTLIDDFFSEIGRLKP